MPDAGRGVESKRLIDFLKLGQEYLEKKEIDEARLKVERLLCHILEKDRIGLYLDFDRPLSRVEIDRFRDLLKRAASDEPIQYIIGETGFYNSEFFVRPGVLIPRPETELIIDLCKKYLPSKGYNNGLDIGCGSGILAITALEEGISAKMTALDVSMNAIYVTCLNAVKHGYAVIGDLELPDNEPSFSDFLLSSGNTITLTKKNTDTLQTLVVCLMDAFKTGVTLSGAPFDLVISNPPYITQTEYDSLPQHIQNHEPEIALRSGQDGLDAHRSLASSLERWLDNAGVYFGEIGAEQQDSILTIYKKSFNNVAVLKDLNNLPRVVHCKKL